MIEIRRYLLIVAAATSITLGSKVRPITDFDFDRAIHDCSDPRHNSLYLCWTVLRADRTRTGGDDYVSFAVHVRKRERRQQRRGLHQLLPRKNLRCSGGLAEPRRAYRNIGYACFLLLRCCYCMSFSCIFESHHGRCVPVIL